MSDFIYLRSDGKRWDGTDPWVPPTVLPPIQRAVTIQPVITYTKTGRLKSVTWPTLPCPMPSGANSAFKAILSRPDLTPIVTYARGYEVNSDGTQKLPKIWQENTPDVDDQRTRIQVGHGEPEPVDSIAVRGYRMASGVLDRVLMGHWVGSSYENGCDWRRGTIESLSATEFANRLKDATDDGASRA